MDNVISSDTIARMIFKYSVTPRMPRSGAQSQVLCVPAIFMNSNVNILNGYSNPSTAPVVGENRRVGWVGWGGGGGG